MPARRAGPAQRRHCTTLSSTEDPTMPTYQYACTECGHSFEQFQSFSEDALTVCPVCEGRLRKLFNAVGVVFKGSGFYRTDSRKDSSPSAPASTPSSTPASASAAASRVGASSSSSELLQLVQLVHLVLVLRLSSSSVLRLTSALWRGPAPPGPIGLASGDVPGTPAGAAPAPRRTPAAAPPSSGDRGAAHRRRRPGRRTHGRSPTTRDRRGAGRRPRPPVGSRAG